MTTVQTVQFTRMADGTKEDYELLHGLEAEYASHLPERILAGLRQLDDGLAGYRITRLEHSLQTATRAQRDGADDDMVVAALIHDIGDELSPFNHAQVAAAILRPYVRAEVTWTVLMHGLFQLRYYGQHVGLDPEAREEYRDHPWYGTCDRFCADWDQASFDPAYPTEPLEAFAPLVREVFTRPAFDPAVLREPEA
jgi:predicted HD phosphohydrolase